MKFQSTHNLDFLSRPYPQKIKDGYNWQQFKIGTVEGLWCYENNAYNILAFDNKEKNNGHFTDVMEWFQHSCKRDKINFKILEVMNLSLKEHLQKNWGFVPCGDNDLIKYYGK